MLEYSLAMFRLTLFLGALLAVAAPAFAQFELTGSYAPRLYEDYIERGPGSDLGDYSGMPLTDEGRAKAQLYTSNLPSTFERQCLAQSAGVFQYRPRRRLDPRRRQPARRDEDLDGRETAPHCECHAHDRRLHHRQMGRRHA